MKIIFLGTGAFAVPIIEKIAIDTDWEVLLVVAQPPKPAGRGGRLTKSPIHEKAEELGLKVETPNTIKGIGLPKSDIIVTAAYGKIIPKEIFDAPKYKTVNIHPSLLPKLRGPSPIQWALLEGLDETGVSLMLIDEELDHGPVISQEKVKIESGWTAAELFTRCAELGAEMVVRDVPRYISGGLKPQDQSHDEATYSRMIKKEDGHVDWSQPSQNIYNRWRAFAVWPGIFSFTSDNLRLKFMSVRSHGELMDPRDPGTVFVYEKSLLVQCGDKPIEVFEIQPEGKKPMSARDFINGHQDILNTKLS